MPELPELETIKKTLSLIKGTMIKQMEIFQFSIIRLQEYDISSLLEKEIIEVVRRGKFLILLLTGEICMIVHLGMSGRFYLLDQGQEPQGKHVHMAVSLHNDSKLIYQDPRRFGGIWLVNDYLDILKHLGIEPLSPDFDGQYLRQNISKRKTAIKNILLNQQIIAGIGNIYADEALFRAGIRPDRPCNTLNINETDILSRAIKDVLLAGIEHKGTTFRDYRDGFNQSGNNQNFLQVYGRTNQTCFSCGENLQIMRIGGRSTHYCSHCQH